VIGSVSDWRDVLESMAGAFARGDSADAEALLQNALDQGVPWDQVTLAAARGIALRFNSGDTGRRNG